MGIDNQSLTEFGRWPWSRTLQGELLPHLDQASIIALDILYLENSDEDEQFAKQLAKYPQLIGALASLPNSQHADEAMKNMLSPYMISDISFADSSKQQSYLLMPELHQLSSIPKPLLPYLSRSGLVHINHSNNNTQLHYVLGMIDNEQKIVVPSFALQILQFWYEKNFSINIDQTNEIFLNNRKSTQFILKDYSGVPLNFYKNSVTTVSAADVLKGKVEPETFKDKIVVIGFTASGLHDTFISPLGPKKGVELHTTLVSNFINDELIQHSLFTNLIVFFLFALLASLVTITKPNSYRARFVLVIVLVFGLFIVDYILFSVFHLWLETFQVLLILLIATSINEIIWSIEQELSSGHLKRAFQSYLSEDLLNMIRQYPEQVNLGGDTKEASFLFSDIRNFSRFSEELNSAELVTTLNKYFNPVTESILQHKGMLDKYIGDSVMAIFNAPVSIPNHPLEACLCALDMNERVVRLNIEQRENGYPELDMGIGINTGKALIGNMGSNIRFSYTAIGDAVNIASRIESITKIYKCDILIGHSTWQVIQSQLLCRYIDTVVLKGREQTSSIYQLLPKNSRNRELCLEFSLARGLYARKNFQEARDAFIACDKKWGDATSLVFADRCLNWIENGIPKDWEDVYHLNDK